MEKKVRICTDKVFVRSMLAVFIVLIASVFLLTAFMDIEPFLIWLCLLAIVLVAWDYAIWVDCNEKEICVTRFGILKRHIRANRISSIQLIEWHRKGQFSLYLVICIDGHRPYNSKNVLMRTFFGLWVSSPKVFAIRILEHQYNEYIKELTELYGNVTLEDSFRKWQTKQAQKKLGRENPL